MRLMSIAALISEIQKVDGNTAVNPGMLRSLVRDKKVKHLYHGDKLRINADQFPMDMNSLFGLDPSVEMPRIRSIHNAFLEVKESNPELGTSEQRIRRLIGMGKLPHIRIGNRAYVALESFDAPYNECLMYDDYQDSEEAMLEQIAKEQLAISKKRRH